MADSSPSIPIVPGRGLNSYSAIEERLRFLENQGYPLAEIRNHGLQMRDIQKNIESFIGSVEIPLGIVGPLLFQQSGLEAELVYCAAGTVEGALIASMNRGAKAISQSGGVQARILYQKMLRAPMFFFRNADEAEQFSIWVKRHFSDIKKQAQLHSNHADLIAIEDIQTDEAVHLKFIYHTGDAAGQNMTTTCTWHAIMWIITQFQEQTDIPILQHVIEGNGSSDKKISAYTIEAGRGVHAEAECFLSDEVLQRVLRTTADKMLTCYHASRRLAEQDGMVGYNINVANAIAAIFVATGQDLASIHESAVGILDLEKKEGGLALKLKLPNLVIGTIGGGTHISRQKEVLELMACYGSGKIDRFATMITSFALALEISTFAAIVSGEFAKAHEKLGRNKPVSWLTRAELDLAFMKRCLGNLTKDHQLTTMREIGDGIVDNGVITTLTSRVSNKLIGFIPLEVQLAQGEIIKTLSLILKSKALDIEVIKGLHLMAASIDPQLSDLLNQYRNKLEYARCHLKEIRIYEQLHEAGFSCMPDFYGKYINEKREIYLLAQELLQEKDLIHIDSQKHPEYWTQAQIKTVIQSITEVHLHFSKPEHQAKLPEVKEFFPWESTPLYHKLVALMSREASDQNLHAQLESMFDYLVGLQEEYDALSPKIPHTLVHNDFNSRNIAIRKDGRACIYDWELAVIEIPHRDIVEFLSFVLPLDFDEKQFEQYLAFHFDLYKEFVPKISSKAWTAAYVYALKLYLLTRISFYEVAGILDRYAFSDRILRNSFRMLDILSP